MHGLGGATHRATKVLAGLRDVLAMVQRAKEIDPGAWSLNGTERRRHAAIKLAEGEAKLKELTND